VNEWIVTEKLGNVLKYKMSSKHSGKRSLRRYISNLLLKSWKLGDRYVFILPFLRLHTLSHPSQYRLDFGNDFRDQYLASTTYYSPTFMVPMDHACLLGQLSIE
jgi:hypothetical protein